MRDRKEMNMERRGVGEEPRRVEGEKTIIKIYYAKKKIYFNKEI